MIDALDTFYSYVKSRVQAINASRQFGGLTDAEDWPSQEVLMEAFYLLTLGETPIGRQGWSAAVPIFNYTLQWSWLIAGSDITATTKGRNRGNRFRTHWKMMDELRIGLFPGFTEKKRAVFASDGSISFTSLDPKEHISWTPVKFNRRIDKASGLIYGIGTTTVVDMSDTIAA